MVDPMGLPNKLEMECGQCKVADECPARGASPLRLGSGKPVRCRLIGGYGQKPVPVDRMSDETRNVVERNGPCLTIAEVPRVDEPSGRIYFETVKIWSQPKLHPRQTTSVSMDRAMGPSAHRRQDPPIR